MSAHDPLCPVFKYPRQICECYFIAKARVDERERIAQAIEAMPNEWIAAVGVAVVRAYAAQIARNGGRDE